MEEQLKGQTVSIADITEKYYPYAQYSSVACRRGRNKRERLTRAWMRTHPLEVEKCRQLL